MNKIKKYETAWEDKWIDALADWFLKDYLKESTDFLEQTKIRITFNISVLPLFALLPYLVSLIIHPIYSSLQAVVINIIALITAALILRYKKNYLLAAKLIVIVSFLALTMDLFFSDTPALVDIIWFAVIVFYSYFTLNKWWGVAILFLSTAVSIIYIQYRLYINFHDESIYTQAQLNNITLSILTAFTSMYYVTSQYLRLFAFTQKKILDSYDEVKEINEKLSESKVELENANELLQSSNRELEAFSYSVSHDLRAPLRSIEGFTTILKEDYSDKIDTEGKRVMGLVINAVGRMNRLIDDILKFSRQSRQSIEKTELNMQSLVSSVINDIESVKHNKKIEFEIKPLLQCKGDLNLISQVFQNLLTNAVKFTSKVEKPKIEIGSYKDGNMNVYYVKDNGAGFDMAHVSKIFNVFQRLHSESEFEGTGIGLAIVKKIIMRHGGNVWAEGKVGEGAAFYFSLPNNGNA